ncbi:hypothetical protein [Streptomyces sp. NPDC051567]|uniref:hypothetical protein n=1 Tax=Streptomyces sp. NPDC051567 TaxID=3365660 RepID=UPI0037B93FAD
MNAYAGPVWSIVLAGRRVEFPATIDTIRAGLSGERASAFDEAVDRTPAKHLLHLLVDFALPERPRRRTRRRSPGCAPGTSPE